MSDYRKPLPRLDDANRPFWDGARAGEVRMQRCAGCGTMRFPAARYCAKCGGDKSEWVATGGRGTVESWCLFHKPYFEGFADEVPYNVAVVRLDEGPRLFTNIVDAPAGGLKIGMRVEATFEEATAEITLVKFKPGA